MAGQRILVSALAVLVAGVLLAPTAARGAPPAEQPRTELPDSDDAYQNEQRMRSLQNLVEETRALGLYLTDDGRIIVVVPSSGRSSFSERDARALGIDVTVTTADLEVDEIARIKSVVMARDWHPEAKNFSVGVLFDARIGKLRVMTDAPTHVYAYLNTEFGDKIVIEHDVPSLARHEDYQPHWGGAQIIKHGTTPQQGYCTSGFSVKTSLLKHRMLTAGHCWPKGTNIKSPEGTTFGSVIRNEWWGRVGNADDMAHMGQGVNDIKMAPEIYVGGVNSVISAGVENATTAVYLVDYCFSGATGGTRCDLRLKDNSYRFCFGGGGCWYQTQYFEGPVGSGVCGGDSGGPFFLDEGTTTPADVGIRGMVVGRLETGNCNLNYVAIIEKWSKIQSVLEVTIKTI